MIEMMELNTDRMLFGIGAVVLGAAILYLVITGFPGVMSMWTYGAAGSVDNVEIAAGSNIVVTNSDFSARSQGWGRNEDSSGIIFDGKTAFVPENEQIFTKLTIPKNSEIKVTFRAKGHGKIRADLSSNDSISSSSEMNLTSISDFHTYHVTLRKLKDNDDYLVFKALPGSEFHIDDVSIAFMGVRE